MRRGLGTTIVLNQLAAPADTEGTRAKLKLFANLVGLRDDWHEPDVQGVSAVMVGRVFDNAHGDDGLARPAAREGLDHEKCIELRVNGKAICRVNLATVLALAAGLEEEGG